MIVILPVSDLIHTLSELHLTPGRSICELHVCDRMQLFFFYTDDAEVSRTSISNMIHFPLEGLHPQEHINHTQSRRFLPSLVIFFSVTHLSIMYQMYRFNFWIILIPVWIRTLMIINIMLKICSLNYYAKSLWVMRPLAYDKQSKSRRAIKSV